MQRLPNIPQDMKHRVHDAASYQAIKCPCGVVFLWPFSWVPPSKPGVCPSCKAVEAQESSQGAGA